MRPYATSVCGRELLVYEAFGCSCTYWWPAATLQQVELTESFSQLHLLEQVNKQAGAELQQKWQEQQRTAADARRAAAAAAQRYSVYLLYWYKSTQFICFTCTKVRTRGGPAAAAQRYSVYLLCWYKSTNTDTCGAARSAERNTQEDLHKTAAAAEVEAVRREKAQALVQVAREGGTERESERQSESES